LADALRADDPIDQLELALDAEIAPLMDCYPDQRSATRYDPGLTVVVDREKARFSTWYEMFPRSCATEPQIMAQVKEAYTVARRGEAIGPIFHQAFERAFAAGKRVRTETHICERAVSVCYDAVELAKKI
jgi:hypothetical protein